MHVNASAQAFLWRHHKYSSRGL